MAVADLRQHGGDTAEKHGDATGNQIAQQRRAVAVWHVLHLDARHDLEQFAGQMG
jgi:hypothetical protein